MPGKGGYNMSYSYDDSYMDDQYSYQETPDYDSHYDGYGGHQTLTSYLDNVDEDDDSDFDGMSESTASELGFEIEPPIVTKPKQPKKQSVAISQGSAVGETKTFTETLLAQMDSPKTHIITVKADEMPTPKPEPLPAFHSQSQPRTSMSTTPKNRSRDDLVAELNKVSVKSKPQAPRYNVLKESVTMAEAQWKAQPSATVLVVGHVDAGKSTVMGHVLHKLGAVDKKALRRLERDATVLGKESFKFAFVMDQDPAERARGVTIDAGSFTVDAPGGRRLHMVDCPGHRDFMPRLISRAVDPNHAVLIVDGSPGEFEAGWSNSGQTKENIQLMRAFGVSHLIVAVNKMDVVGWDKNRYNAIRAQTHSFLRTAGFVEGKNLYYVPVSGLKGDNLTAAPTEAVADWAKKSTIPLVQQIEALPLSTPDFASPLRMSIGDSTGESTAGLGVKVLSGVARVGDPLVLVPGGFPMTIRRIDVRGNAGIMASKEIAVAGDFAELSVLMKSAGDEANLLPGTVLAHPGHEPAATQQVRATIATFDLTAPIVNGSDVELFTHAVRVPACIVRLSATLAKGGVDKTVRPTALRANMQARVQLRFPKQVVMDAGRGALGRFVIRRAGKSIAVGVVSGVRE
ncbi:Elongation factor Tu GTP binding domain [Carpediemonas membranifera]|uniref:Elongation factor Tu GTP binding domain n=1 Tax=Carpediemonas membranifera TaxID=201153 RepID=A0A8J6E4R0_9EUKA|nr:Elongation factor Tu GTP binding domain [Carpediemonas membranifera]|eukprot:KAG9397256.1 Elongation factor Tu GTP binding domain [Carpediemonas membranifera]